MGAAFDTSFTFSTAPALVVVDGRFVAQWPDGQVPAAFLISTTAFNLLLDMINDALERGDLDLVERAEQGAV